MYLKKLIPLIILLFIWQLAIPQIPPANPHLIDSPFPLVHRNNYRQGYSDLPALFGRDSIRVRTLLTPNDRVSPWLQLSEVYPDGSRTLWGSTSTHIWKAYSTPDSFFLVDAYQIDFNPAINDLSWAFLQLGNHQVLTYDDNRLLKFADQNPNDPLSPILLVEEDSVPAGIGTPAKLTRLYDGSIAFASDIGVIGLIDDNLNLLDTLRLPLAADETAFHNDFASDEKGGIYTITSKKMMRLQVTNQQLFVDWQVPRDFGGNNIQGVGTTPTLLGNESDRLVCVVDSKQPANLLSFWRDSIPADWTGLPGEDIRIAAVTPLPNSGPISPLYTAVENSPVAYGYGIACAQYNGLLGQSCQTAKGVYKMEWDTLNNRMELMWHRQDINLNNVLAYSRPDNLIYGSGREDDCLYYYYGLDWQTGETELKVPLGAQPYFDDPGNANVILDDGSIVYNSKERLIQVQPVARPLGLAQENDPIQLRVFPNPSQGILKLEWE
ncbi:MAG: hypothetical protein AAF206_12015, partial [Bacteroidota bacterium]